MEYLTEWMLMARIPNTLPIITQVVEGLSNLEYPPKLILNRPGFRGGYLV
jgi:hypothetical protein